MENGIPVTVPSFADQFSSAQDTSDGGKSAVNIFGMDLNYAASNLWYCFLPLENILGRKYGNLNLHLTRFSLPQMQMQSTTVSYKGVQKKIPTKVFNPDDKTLTLDYIVDENWQNYRALFAWMSGITGAINTATDDENQSIQPSDYIPLRIYLLDNYKRKVIQFVFENCWCETFNDLTLEQNNPGEITHSFTFNYDRYYIEDMPQDYKKADPPKNLL